MNHIDDYTKAFLGTGWAFPVALNSEGKIATEKAEADIRQSLRIILGTNPGERLMRPDFGAGLSDFVFEPVNTSTKTQVKKRVEEALTAWEPRIQVIEVRVISDHDKPQELLIDVCYQVGATNSRHNFVYPFYLDEGGAQ